MKNAILGFAAILGFVGASCLTINVYFPAAAVQQAADSFVKDVQASAKDGEDAKTATPKNSPTNAAPEKKSAESGFLNLSFVHEANAQAEEAINIDTPEAKKIKESMKTRFAEISAFKDKGAIGENAAGLLAERDVQGLPLPERAKVKALLTAANGERQKLYEEVVRANDYPKEKLKEVHSIFARSWQANSKSGWWVQNPDGSWVRK